MLRSRTLGSRSLALLVLCGVLAACDERVAEPSGPDPGSGAPAASRSDQHDFGTRLRPIGDAPTGQPTGEVVDTPEGPLRRMVFHSATYEIDRIYKSMQGPTSVMSLTLSRSQPELIWIKGIYSEVVGPEGEPDVSQEFMCHVVGAIESPRLGYDITEVDTRFGTLSQGQDYKQYPEGFGYPILATDPIRIESQVLNHNIDDAEFRVRHRVVVLFIVDREARVPMKPLRSEFAQVMVRVGGEGEGGVFGVLEPEGVTEDMSCSPGERAHSELGLLPDDLGRLYSAHFMVEPGRVEFRTLVTEQLDLEYDTRIHAIDVHVHPYAESLELRDLTTNEVLFKSHVTLVPEGVGVQEVETYRSAEGIPVYKDHHYAMVAVYDNTTDAPVDAMASFYIGLEDRSIDVEALRRGAAPAPL